MVKNVVSTALMDPSSEVAAQKKRLKESCKEFESVMMGFVLKSMRDSVMKAEEPSQAQQIVEDMMDQSLSGEIGREGVGLGDMLYRSLEPLIKADAARTPQQHAEKPTAAVAETVGEAPEKCPDE